MLQCVQGDFVLQRTHGILNFTDKGLRHSSKIASAVRYNGGPVIDSSCMKYIKDNGALQAGTVESLSAGDLACFCLFHGISPIWEEDNIQEAIIHEIITKAIKLADYHNCKSLSIPIFKCGKYPSSDVPLFVISIYSAIAESTIDLKVLKIIRAICLSQRKLDIFVESVETRHAVRSRSYYMKKKMIT